MINDKPSLKDYTKAKLKSNKSFITCSKTGRVYKEVKADLIVKFIYLAIIMITLAFLPMFILLIVKSSQPLISFLGLRVTICYLISYVLPFLLSPLTYYLQKFEEVDNNYYIVYGIDLRNKKIVE